MAGVIDRCPTGIEGFDEITDGGFVRNSDNLIVGGPGSGKTTFLLQFLWNGATRYNENGLYCSFEPDIIETLNDAMAYGWDFTKLSEEGRIKFMRFSPKTSVEDLKSELVKMISRNDVRRICFDPISVLALNLDSSGKIREKIFELSSLMKRLRVTTVYADETLEGEGLERHTGGDWTKTDILKFLSDSVTLFYDYGIQNEGDRALRIIKMRRTAHFRDHVSLNITSNGLEINSPETKELEIEKIQRDKPKKIKDLPKLKSQPEVKSVQSINLKLPPQPRIPAPKMRPEKEDTPPVKIFPSIQKPSNNLSNQRRSSNIPNFAKLEEEFPNIPKPADSKEEDEEDDFNRTVYPGV